MLENIKLLREKNNISQQKLGEIVGVSQQSINKYENHNVEPDINTLKRLADYFNTSIDFIVGYTNIERKLEKITPTDLNDTELRHIENFRHLSAKQQKSIDFIIENYIAL
ncbi:MAG: helix-turn-helix transcriptional regulator [Clostridia bacterium]|nr:helix-turn-helix transcriptional regulator [Clostridia bacterium]